MGVVLERLTQIRCWVQHLFPGESIELAPASADASFRRYFRILLGGDTRILMDAPPDREDCGAFLRVGRVFAAAGVHVPEVLAKDVARGFLLLSDLGATTYLQALADGDADALYRDAIMALVRIQRASRADVLPVYDEALLQREMYLFPEWYVRTHCQFALTSAQQETIQRLFVLLLRNNLSQPRVFVHRDYHSRNLMVADPNPGILDFQDAVTGPVTYDLVSLLKDAYIDWEEPQVIDWAISYWEQAKSAALPVSQDFAVFYRDFEWMGVQRHLKVLGIFARLAHRDGKTGYLDDMPRVWTYLHKTCMRYDELRPLARLLEQLANQPSQTGYTF